MLNNNHANYMVNLHSVSGCYLSKPGRLDGLINQSQPVPVLPSADFDALKHLRQQG